GLGGSLYPLSAVIGKEEFNICQDISLGHYTHEKSPLGCAIGNAVIEYIENNTIPCKRIRNHTLYTHKRNESKI
ncbi:aspartate aminotransferase family protein, partial [Megamonas funiformis]|nr:aspartate aminotransferase family protein [Megamonas funiformis]